VAWPPTEEEQLVAKMRDMTFARGRAAASPPMRLRAWLLRHRAAQVVGDTRRRVKEPPRAAIGQPAA